jgi:hypothetical protein
MASKNTQCSIVCNREKLSQLKCPSVSEGINCGRVVQWGTIVNIHKPEVYVSK